LKRSRLTEQRLGLFSSFLLLFWDENVPLFSFSLLPSLSLSRFSLSHLTTTFSL
jgi:hypothetical protein